MLIPCAIVMLATIIVLGPPLGRALFDPGSNALWPANWWEARGHAEPAKHGRYVLAALAPLVLAGVILVVSRRPPRLHPRTARALVLAGQAGVVGIVVVAFLGQRHLILYTPAAAIEKTTMPDTFSIRDLVVATMLVAGAAIVLRRRRVAASIVAFARERRLSRVAGLAISAAFAAAWLVEAILSDSLIEDTGGINWIPDGAFAVLDGRTPLVDVHLIYAKLLPYPTALVLAAFGANLFFFTLFLALLDLAAMLAVYAVFRRLVGSAFAVALFLPFVALSDGAHLMWIGGGVWPMRYFGAYLVAWLTARHLDGAGPRRRWIIFFVAGLVALDTFDFGIAALLASIVALICAQPPRSLRDAARLAGAVTAGALGAMAVVSALTLARTGELPHLDLLFEWPRIFTDLGWFSLPLPTASLHLAIYAALAGAVAVAAVRLARRAEDVLLTAMLAWSGIFGLIAGNYYVARPDDFKLYAMFSAGAFAVALLTIVCVRALAARGWRAPAPAELLVLFSFALAVVMIGRFPSPWEHVRLLREVSSPRYRSIIEPFVAQHTQRGEKVAILLPESYRIAYDLGLDNVAPYEMENAIVTKRQMATLLAVLEREGVTRLFTPTIGSRILGEAEAPEEHIAAFEAAGFKPIDSVDNMLGWERG